MNSELFTTEGLHNGRDWESLSGDEGPLEWTLDHEHGLVQGPLDLEFLRGRKISLTLEPGQMALLTRNRELKAVYLDGAHYLDIGHGTHQVPAECQLVFLAADRPINLNWSPEAPLQLGSTHGQTLIGGCSLTIDAPARFYRTFLDTEELPPSDFLFRLIDQVVRGSIEEILGGMFEAGVSPGPSEIQSRLTRLTPQDLQDDLDACGLSCLNLAVYTAAPPVEDTFVTVGAEETAGHLDGVEHN